MYNLIECIISMISIHGLPEQSQGGWKPRATPGSPAIHSWTFRNPFIIFYLFLVILGFVSYKFQSKEILQDIQDADAEQQAAEPEDGFADHQSFQISRPVEDPRVPDDFIIFHLCRLWKSVEIWSVLFWTRLSRWHPSYQFKLDSESKRWVRSGKHVSICELFRSNYVQSTLTSRSRCRRHRHL